MPVSKNRRKTQKRKQTPKKARKASPSEAGGTPPLPDRRAMERLMAQVAAGLFDESDDADDDPLGAAQELMYDAWDAGSKRERVALARQALEISPLCADAYVLLAEETAKDLLEARELYARGVEAGEEALGAAAFEEDAGHFWGILKTRPYMRARAGLAECLWALSEREAAVAHLRDMLRLNPNDNQGLRYRLFSWLLALGDDEAQDELLETYREEATADWCYARALGLFRKEGPSAAARAALAAARQCNAFVIDYLIGAGSLPRRLPDFYAPGSKEEAVLYAAHSREVWSATPGALAWLGEAKRRSS